MQKALETLLLHQDTHNEVYTFRNNLTLKLLLILLIIQYNN